MNLPKPTRRELFIQGACAAMTTAAVRSVIGAEIAEKAAARPTDEKGGPLPASLKLSVAGYSFRDVLDKPGKPGKMTLFDLADLAARLGLDAIEPTSYYFLKTDDAYLHALKRKAFLAGLEISGTPVGNNFCLPKGPELDEQIKRVKTWVDYCVKLGSPAIRIFAGSAPKNLSRDEAFANVVAAMREACAYAGERGIFLAIENHGYLTETADDVLRLLEAAKHDWLGINLDTGNFRSDPYGSIAKVAPHAVTCQIKIQVRNPETDKPEPADLGRIIRILREARYRGYVALEYEGTDPHREVPVYLRRLQELLRATA